MILPGATGKFKVPPMNLGCAESTTSGIVNMVIFVVSQIRLQQIVRGTCCTALRRTEIPNATANYCGSESTYVSAMMYPDVFLSRQPLLTRLTLTAS